MTKKFKTLESRSDINLERIANRNNISVSDMNPLAECTLQCATLRLCTCVLKPLEQLRVEEEIRQIESGK